MLTQIRVKNFKGFKEETAFPLTQLTLLTGINGRGKSTLLQTLLLMRQSLEHDDSAAQLVLNGSCVNLGSFNEIRNSNISRNEPIIFRYYYNHRETVKNICLLEVNGFAEYCFNEILEDNMVAQISSILFNDEVILNNYYVVNGDKVNSTKYRLDTIYKKSENSHGFKKSRFEFNTVKKSSLQSEEKKESGSCSLLNLLPFAG